MKTKHFVFISDFDGTITSKDFYWILLDDYIGKKGIDFYHEWKKSKKIGTEFLNTVFGWRPLSEEECTEAIGKVQIDESLKTVIEWVEDLGGDFWILSAGFSYYIERVLERHQLDHVTLYTNPGSFENHVFKMNPQESSPFYSPVYGIDKQKVALYAKERYEYVIFAGDSEPDYHAAVHADLIFAKHELAKLLDQQGKTYIPYDNFKDILSYLKNLD